jgi:predicted dehydrogenase
MKLCCYPTVLIEKPLTPTLAEAQELVDLAREKNLVLAPFQNRRWDADFLAVQGLLKENKVCSIYNAIQLREIKRYSRADTRSWSVFLCAA